jgi:hypothetical protein
MAVALNYANKKIMLSGGGLEISKKTNIGHCLQGVVVQKSVV